MDNKNKPGKNNHANPYPKNNQMKSKKGLKFIRIDLKAMKAEFEQFVSLDIKEFGKPAFAYYYNHAHKMISACDSLTLFNMEMSNLSSKGFSFKELKNDITINNKIYNCDIVIAQPLGNDGDIDTSKYNGFSSDPLASSLGLLITGFCYIKFPTS